jgi:hypothetical protein
MVEFSGITSMLMQWVINPLMWLILILVFFIGTIAILWVRRRRKLKYPVAEIVDLGNGRTGINTDLKAGWFGKKLYLKGLWWTGEEVMRTSEGDTVEYFSTEDFQEVNGTRGVVCYRDPVRYNVLLPISKLNITNKELMAAIAPADFTDVAVSIVKDAAAETSDWKDKLIQFAGWALVVVFSLVTIIVVVQYVKNGQAEAAKLLIQAGDKGAAACRDICKEAVNIAVNKVAGGAP